MALGVALVVAPVGWSEEEVGRGEVRRRKGREEGKEKIADSPTCPDGPKAPQ